MKFETIKLTIDGVNTVVKAVGNGPSVLALHGAATIEGQDWALGLADRFRVFLPFHPGFGDSGPAPHVCGMQDMVIHTLRLIDVLELDRPHLVGHSMGGWMAAELAAFAGERFSRLVLNAPAGLTHPEHQRPEVSKIAPQDLPYYLAHRVEAALQYFPGGALAPPKEEFVALREKEGKMLANILKGYGFGHPNLVRWLSRIPNETLIFWGEKDRMIPADLAQTWARAIPKARAHIVPDVGHFPLQEDPASLSVIRNFLAEAATE